MGTAAGPSKRNAAFIAGVAFVILVFLSFGAHASTYAWFLLSAMALWVALGASRESRLRGAGLEAALHAERQERIDQISRLIERVRELETTPRRPTGVDPAPSAPTPGIAPPLTAPAFPVVTKVPRAAADVRESPVATLPESPRMPDTAPPIPKSSLPAKDWTKTFRSFLDFEQILGTNWLSKLGVGVLVLGIAFFLAWQLREVGPLGKVVTGIAVSALLLGGGLWGDRHQLYQLLGRAALAGGWALLYFVAYAAHHVPATHVIASPLLGLLLMLIVAAAMVTHTLRFRSQMVTGLAFLLAFLTVTLNRVDVYSLSSNVILAIGLCLVAVRMQWFEMEIVGMLAVYLNHYLWLMPIIEPMHRVMHPFPQSTTSTILLLLYWAVFRISYVVRAPQDEKFSALAGVLNTVLLLSVVKYQSAHPELAFIGLLTLGVIELGLAQLPIVKRKRTTFVVLNTLGAALIVAAVPFRFAPDYVSALWLIEAQIFLAVGILIRERVFRILGTLAAGMTAMQLLSVHGARVVGDHLGGADVLPHWTLGTIVGAATLTLYADACWLPQRWPALFAREIDKRLLRVLSYAAALLGVLDCWILFPGAGAAVAWIALAIILAIVARRFTLPDLTLQANIIAALAILRVLVVNLPSSPAAIHALFGISDRLLSVSAVVAMLYLLARWNRSETLSFTRRLPEAVAWAATGLASLLLWYELRPASVAIAWAMLALLILECGEIRRSLNLRIQAYLLLGAAFIRVFLVNLNADPQRLAIAPRILTILPIALALFTVHQRLETSGSGHERERQWYLPSTFAWLSATCLVALVRFEFSSDAVATVWAALTLAFVAVAWAIQRRVFLHIGIALSLATLGRAMLHDLYERTYFPWPGKAEPWILVGGAVALLWATLPFAFRLRRVSGTTAPDPVRRTLMRLDERPEQVFFFVPLVLLTVFLATEVRRDLVTVVWGVEAVVVFLFAVWVKERSFRLAGLALLLLCAAKVLLIDFWSLGIRDKALTGIVMGLALIGVSFLYTHRRDVIRQLL